MAVIQTSITEAAMLGHRKNLGEFEAEPPERASANGQAFWESRKVSRTLKRSPARVGRRLGLCWGACFAAWSFGRLRATCCHR